MPLVGIFAPARLADRDVATWGTRLHDASNVALLGDVPRALAPAVPIFLDMLDVNIAARDVHHRRLDEHLVETRLWSPFLSSPAFGRA